MELWIEFFKYAYNTINFKDLLVFTVSGWITYSLIEYIKKRITKK